MDKKYWKSILMRAWHTVWETLASTIPASIVVTPAMIQKFDISVIYVVLAWLATGLLAGGLSIVKSLAAGVPECNNEEDSLDDIEEGGDRDVQEDL